MDTNNVKNRKMKHWQVMSILLAIYDAVAIAAAFFLALWLRYDCRYTLIRKDFLVNYLHIIPIYIGICLVVFWFSHLYKSIWRFASFNELIKVGIASLITAGANVAYTMAMGIRMPWSYFIIGTFLQFVFTLAARVGYRFIIGFKKRNSAAAKRKKHVMIIGAGQTGQTIFNEIKLTDKLNEKLCCFIDDENNKWGRYVDGVVVEGGRDSILAAVEKYKIEKIYIAIPSATAAQRRDIINICNETGCEILNMPGIYQFSRGEVSISKMREVAIEDLLGRDPIKQDMKEVFDYIYDKVVMVTGGGGSIGSELVRQIAAHYPKQLIIFDVYENNAYDIQLEIKKKYPKLDLVTLIGSVRDSRKMFSVFEKYRPDIVYHAAAHKHVPLMEDSPCEAIKNNTIGTYKTAFAAVAHGCKKFVLISTDKAVNPTNIMGASKRTCEMVVQAFDYMVKQHRANELPQLFTHLLKEPEQYNAVNESLKNAKTEFVAVRFGNVLGSNGSVIPLFKKQIANGGPVTVTHPDIIRYFMTIPEAVNLVLQAGTYAKGGEIFVLDMGEPVKIVDLARNLIRLSGFKPDEEIKIVYTGLRPGEKLYEEKLMAEEGLKKTDNNLIHIGCPIPFDIEVFLGQLEELMDTAYKNKSDEEMKQMVQKVVSTYHPA